MRRPSLTLPAVARWDGLPIRPTPGPSLTLPARTRTARTLAALMLALALPACQQEMARQPSYRPLEPSEFFPDGRSARPLVDGTVARGQLLVGDPLITARKPGKHPPSMKPDDFVADFPFEINEADLKRGEQRYLIFCAVCHDPLGTGNGKIVERGYLPPPSYHTDDSRGFALRGIEIPLRDAPVGYYFEVISQGFGGMPSYASQVPPRDRWRIIAHIRVLQLSQHARLDELPAGLREETEKRLSEEAP
jgi:hypothetical protein